MNAVKLNILFIKESWSWNGSLLSQKTKNNNKKKKQQFFHWFSLTTVFNV